MYKKENYVKLSRLEKSALIMIVFKQSPSTALLQRTFEIGFPRAVRIIDNLCAKGFISEQNNQGGRKILITKEECLELLDIDDITKEESDDKVVSKEKFFDAVRELSLDLLKGVEVNKNTEQAMNMLQKSAESGNTFSKETLGVLFYDGKEYGIKQDLKKAFYWFDNAYLDKTGISAYYLGEMFYYGNGVEQNYEKAYKLLTESVDLGCTNGYYILGKMYENGEYVKKDLHKAFDMFFEGAKYDNQEAKEYLEKIFCERK